MDNTIITEEEMTQLLAVLQKLSRGQDLVQVTCRPSHIESLLSFSVHVGNVSMHGDNAYDIMAGLLMLGVFSRA